MNGCVIIGCQERADRQLKTPTDDKLWYCLDHANYMLNSEGKKDGYEVILRA